MIKYIVTILFFMAALMGVTYQNLEYKGYSRAHSCTGECYAEYVKEHGSVVDQLMEAQAAAAEDPFSSVRGLWAGCAALLDLQRHNVKLIREGLGTSADPTP